MGRAPIALQSGRAPAADRDHPERDEARQRGRQRRRGGVVGRAAAAGGRGAERVVEAPQPRRGAGPPPRGLLEPPLRVEQAQREAHGPGGVRVRLGREPEVPLREVQVAPHAEAALVAPREREGRLGVAQLVRRLVVPHGPRGVARAQRHVAQPQRGVGVALLGRELVEARARPSQSPADVPRQSAAPRRAARAARSSSHAAFACATS